MIALQRTPNRVIARASRSYLEPRLELLIAERAQGEELQRQNVELAGRCDYLQAWFEAGEKQVLALTAPPEPDRPQTPWWRRILGLSPAA